ncbi:MAG: signal peptidase I [Bdellovibrionaceae bacterium]|nr:signal peptidase I [Pseudobdellovibrionaceae bacterium]
MEFIKRNRSLLAFAICLFAFRWSFADQYHVPTGSMEPTIHVGDRIVVNKAAYQLRLPFTTVSIATFSEPNRGDVVVFDNPVNGVCMVKRIVGLPGDTVAIKNGFVAINGAPLPGTFEGMERLAESQEESEIYYRERIGDTEVEIKRLPHRLNGAEFHLTIPAGHYFAMGDNRDNSADSRIWGLIRKQDLKGKAIGIFFNVKWASTLIPTIDWQRIGISLNDT